MVRQLLPFIDASNPYEYTVDFVKRRHDCKVGATDSKHKEELAIDIHLYLLEVSTFQAAYDNVDPTTPLRSIFEVYI